MARKTWDFRLDVPVVIDVEVHCHGFDQDAVTGGPPDAWEPPESEDERGILGATIGGKRLPMALLAKLAEYLRPEIRKADIESEIDAAQE